MMMHHNITMTSKVKKETLLKKLRENLEQHSRIVAEARAGYLKKAREALEHRLRDLGEGKIVHLGFDLIFPSDHSEVYRSVIKMLEWTTEDEITLAADEFRQLVEDEWGWTGQFFASNKMYSGTAAHISAAKGY